MSPDGFDPAPWATAAIALAVAFGVLRLWLRRRAARPEGRGPVWRLALLVALQIAAGGLLHLVLFPPGGLIRTGAMVVLTGPGMAPVELAADDVLVALPEAGAVEGAVRVPDLATALRRYPDAARVRVLGPGLPPRDQRPVPLPLTFDPPPPPRGLVDLTFPEPVAPGGVFVVGGQVGGLPAGVVELIDPAGALADRVPVTTGQRFELRADARAPGLAVFTLRLRDRAGALVEEIAAPVETQAQAQPRVLVLAGAPEPETKFLRRWAQDSGITLNVQIEVGGGVQLGDPPVPLTPAGLSRFDLAVVDERRWEALGPAGRTALTAAVNGGLGLLLRPTGPLSDATRRDWAALGLQLTDRGGVRPLRLPPSRRPGAEASDGPEADMLPELERRDLGHESPDGVSILRAADGAALASWRARGRGRVGVWTVTDSYALVLSGRPDLYAELWSDLFTALARPGGEGRARVDGLPRAGARAVVCGLGRNSRLLGPDGEGRALLPDPATGEAACAASWPEAAGWWLLRDAERRETAVYVHPAGAAPSLLAADNRRATLSLTGEGGGRTTAAPGRRAPGSPWPWFSLLLAALAGLWWLERNGVAPRTRAGAGV